MQAPGPGFFKMLPVSAALVCACWLAIGITGCTKPEEVPIPMPDTTRPQPLQPTGIIKEFVSLDSVIGFMKGSTLRWNVTETNSSSIVYLEGVKVATYGTAQTGPLTQTTNFLLSVNSGKTATATVYVADSLATLLWSEGRRWRVVDALTYETQTVNGVPAIDWFSHFNDRLANERAYFYLDGTSKEVNVSPNYPQPKASGKYTTRFNPLVVPPNLYRYSLSWKGRLYNIDTLTDTKLTMTYDSTLLSGLRVSNRVRYRIEY